MLLYKYVNYEIARNIVINHEIRFSQPGALNDVFEMIPAFKNTVRDEFFIKILNQAIDGGMLEKEYGKVFEESYSNLDENTKRYFSKDEYEIFLQNYISHILMKEQKSFPEYILEKFKSMDIRTSFSSHWINVLNNHIGIFCLSEIYDSDLMWANYSQNHTGIVLEFETDHHFFNPIFKVEYSTEIPEINLEEFEEMQNNPFKYINIIKKKSVSWNYEREFRVFKSLNQKDRLESKLDSLLFQIYLFKFPPHCLKGIIFGARSSEKSINNFVKFINYDLYKDVRLYNMVIDHESRTFLKKEI